MGWGGRNGANRSPSRGGNGRVVEAAVHGL
jgi:hypothetical protein